jgi:outer membrane murein-binding lipoprotein Lpp
MDESERLSLSNQVHVLSNEVSHLKARVDKMREDRKRREGRVDKELDELATDVRELEGLVEDVHDFVENRKQERKVKRKKTRKKEIWTWKKKRQVWLSILIAVVSALLTVLVQWLI